MSVNWLWKDKMGYLIYKYGDHEPYQVNVYKVRYIICDVKLINLIRIVCIKVQEMCNMSIMKIIL